METYKFENLVNEYERFQHPKAIIKVNNKSLANSKKGFPVSDIVVDLTSGFEASVAEFSIYEVFDRDTGSFLYSKVKKYILIGSEVEVLLGYGPRVRTVFVGVITRVNFLFEEEGAPCIRVTAMDVKGIMMSSCYSKQLKALYYSDAVKEILEKTAYEKLRMNNIIRDVKITGTADKLRGLTSGSGLGLDSLASAAGLGGVMDQVTQATDKLSSAVSSGIGGSAMDLLGDAADSLTGGAAGSLLGAAGGLADSVTGIAGSVAGAAGSLTGGGGGAAGALAGAADALTGGLAGSVMDAAGSIADAASEVTDAINDVAEAAGDLTAMITDRSIEMVAESDYEFVVKAAKKNNFEFYTECGVVYFRKAKSDTKILMTIGPYQGMRSFDISYDITGMVNKVIARGTDAGKARVISAKQKYAGKLSTGNKAKALIKGSEKVVLDASITSPEEAAERAASVAETMSYRLGSLRCNMVGLPELHPGHFIQVEGLGTGADNLFYLTRVRHVLDPEGTYISEISGKASSIGQTGGLTGLTGLTGV